MQLPPFQFVEPQSIDETLHFLEEHGRESKLIAGGTDMLPSMKQRIYSPKYIVDLEHIGEMDQILFDGRSGLQLGALVKLHTVETNGQIADKLPILSQAAAAVGSPQLRLMGTVGGNLCLDTRCYYYNQSNSWRKTRPKCIKLGGDVCNAIGSGKKCFAVFSGDLASALIVLDAQICLRSVRGERKLALRDFYTGDGAKPIDIKPDEILWRVMVPPQENRIAGIYLKYRIRKSIDYPLAAIAAVLRLDGKDNICRDARVVINAVGARPTMVSAVSQLMEGQPISGSLIENASQLAFKAARPIKNTASSPEHRKLIIKALVTKALNHLQATLC